MTPSPAAAGAIRQTQLSQSARAPRVLNLRTQALWRRDTTGTLSMRICVHMYTYIYELMTNCNFGGVSAEGLSYIMMHTAYLQIVIVLSLEISLAPVVIAVA